MDASKIKTLNYSSEVYPMINKFFSSITDKIISSKELVQIVNYLSENGIVIQRPSQHKILANGYEFIYNQVEKIKSLGELDIFVANPEHISCKSLAQRIEYLQGKRVPYKNEDGKYAKCLFSVRLWNQKYGNEMKTSEIPDNNEINVENKQGNTEISENNVTNDPIYEILSNDPVCALTDETFEKYELLYDVMRRVAVEVYNALEINESLSNNLIKLIVSGYMEDADAIYLSMTYGKNISDEEQTYLKKAIKEILQEQMATNGRAL